MYQPDLPCTPSPGAVLQLQLLYSSFSRFSVLLGSIVWSTRAAVNSLSLFAETVVGEPAVVICEWCAGLSDSGKLPHCSLDSRPWLACRILAQTLSCHATEQASWPVDEEEMLCFVAQSGLQRVREKVQPSNAPNCRSLCVSTSTFQASYLQTLTFACIQRALIAVFTEYFQQLQTRSLRRSDAEVARAATSHLFPLQLQLQLQLHTEQDSTKSGTLCGRKTF
ncbi:hypothetical protein F5884DRAFT_873071 [Xylogone sp. PMI_703]|nr:hypothetical protein F5884DRAFT_873071 [Xylogone sp. PMI_703]